MTDFDILTHPAPRPLIRTLGQVEVSCPIHCLFQFRSTAFLYGLTVLP